MSEETTIETPQEAAPVEEAPKEKTQDEINREWDEMAQAIFRILAGKPMPQVVSILGTVLGRSCQMTGFSIDAAVDVVLGEYRLQKQRRLERANQRRSEIKLVKSAEELVAEEAKEKSE